MILRPFTFILFFGFRSVSASTVDTEDSSCSEVAHVPPIDPTNQALIETYGVGTIRPLHPIGAVVTGIDLRGKTPPEPVLDAMEAEMAKRGFLVFKGQHNLTVPELLNASVWWGGQALHSTHGVHPATPGRNKHIFRLSNDRKHGILGVGPQWHNDGSFVSGTFSHVGYYIVRVPENGGGTSFAHQGAAYDALTAEQQEYWSRLSSVNSNSGVVHPVIHEHPISKRKSVWLHLGMTGAIIEKIPDGGFRTLNVFEMKKIMNEYNNLLTAGFTYGYAMTYEYEDGDCIFADNLAVAHRASPEAHLPASQQGLRIMHRTTVAAFQDFEPSFGLPQYFDIERPNPFGDGGVWIEGSIGFRWDDEIAMQN